MAGARKYERVVPLEFHRKCTLLNCISPYYITDDNAKIELLTMDAEKKGSDDCVDLGLTVDGITLVTVS